jgi:hypothetical protein
LRTLRRTAAASGSLLRVSSISCAGYSTGAKVIVVSVEAGRPRNRGATRGRSGSPISLVISEAPLPQMELVSWLQPWLRLNQQR